MQVSGHLTPDEFWYHVDETDEQVRLAEATTRRLGMRSSVANSQWRALRAQRWSSGRGRNQELSAAPVNSTGSHDPVHAG